jgi:hypothetical protein
VPQDHLSSLLTDCIQTAQNENPPKNMYAYIERSNMWLFICGQIKHSF